MKIFPSFFSTLILIAALSLLIPNSLIAQQKALKINASIGGYFNQQEFWAGRFAPVFLKNTQSGGIHQFEWSQFSISIAEERRIDNIAILGEGTQSIIDLGWRYQYSHPLVKGDKKIIPYIGFSLGFNSFYHSYNPTSPDRFLGRFYSAKFTYSTVPSLRYNLNEHLFFDFELPIEILSTSADFNRTDNPNLPVRQQRTQVMNLDIPLLNKMEIRVGLGAYLVKKEK